MQLPTPCWSNKDECFDPHGDRIVPLFDHRYVEIKPIVTSLHQTDSDVVLARACGVMKFCTFSATDEETAAIPEFESVVKLKLLEEMYFALYLPIAIRIKKLRGMVKADEDVRVVLDELDVLLAAEYV